MKLSTLTPTKMMIMPHDPFSFLLRRSEKSRRERESQGARIREGNVRVPM